MPFQATAEHGVGVGERNPAPVTFTMALHLPREASSPRSCAGFMACHAGRRSTSSAGIRSPRSPAHRGRFYFIRNLAKQLLTLPHPLR